MTFQNFIDDKELTSLNQKRLFKRADLVKSKSKFLKKDQL